MRILDLTFVYRAEDGTLDMVELEDLDPDDLVSFEPVEGVVSGLLNSEDIRALGESVPRGSSAALIVWEDLWAVPLTEAVRASGGRLVAHERIPADVAEAAVAASGSAGFEPAPPANCRHHRIALEGAHIMPIFRGPGMNRRGPGLLGTVARTAVVAGTASAVGGRVQRRQQGKWGAQEVVAQQQVEEQRAVQQQQSMQQQMAPSAPAADGLLDRLERLAELKKQGVLTEAEFEAQKAKILAG